MVVLSKAAFSVFFVLLAGMTLVPSASSALAEPPEEAEAAALALSALPDEDLDADVTEAAAPTAADRPDPQEGLAEPTADAPGALTEDGYYVTAFSGPIDSGGTDVLVVGVTWAGQDDGVASVEIRTRSEGDWGPWSALEFDLDDVSGRGGTDPYVVTEAAEIEVRMLTVDGVLPVDSRVDLVRTDVSAQDREASRQADRTADDPVEQVSAVGATGVAGGLLGRVGMGVAALPSDISPSGATLGAVTAPRPAINLRSTWGAQPYIGSWAYSQVRGVVVHHTAGSNTYSRDDVPAILRGIQNYHVKGRGWSDIGYNLLVDKFGRVWEGREGGVTNPIQGVHASGYNAWTFGVSVIGNYDAVDIPGVAVDALTRTIAWKLAVHSVLADSTMVVSGEQHPAVIGHRDVAQTACPGRYLYPRLSSIARNARAMQSVVPRTAVNHDLSGDDRADIVSVEDGAVWLYPATTAPVTNAREIGRGWQNMDAVIGSPAVDGSATTDVIARDGRTGRLYVYMGNGAGAFRRTVHVGRGWETMSQIIAPGDWTGDGVPDLMAIEQSTGYLYLFRGRGDGKFDNRRRVGTGWAGMSSVSGVGDFNGDGLPDLAAIDRPSGQLRLYANDGRGGVANGRLLLTGWGNFDGIVQTGDFSRDGNADFVARDIGLGRMVTVRGTGEGGVAGTNAWGSGWTTLPFVIAGMTWSGSGGPDIIAIRADGDMVRYERGMDLSSRKRLFPIEAGTEVVVVGDVVGDGTADIVTLSPSGVLRLHVISERGTVGSTRQLATGWDTVLQVAAAGDYSGDGIPDLLMTDSSGRLSVRTMTRDGELGTSWEIGSGFASWLVTGTGGWERTSAADIVALNLETGELRVFAGRRDGRLTLLMDLGVFPHAMSIVGVGDVTGESEPDILVTDDVGEGWLYPGGGRTFGPRMALAGLLPTSAELS